jgi:hypothetical protein
LTMEGCICGTSLRRGRIGAKVNRLNNLRD